MYPSIYAYDGRDFVVEVSCNMVPNELMYHVHFNEFVCHELRIDPPPGIPRPGSENDKDPISKRIRKSPFIPLVRVQGEGRTIIVPAEQMRKLPPGEYMITLQMDTGSHVLHNQSSLHIVDELI